ncbi:MAG: SIMPL domain-containing protein [Muribaculaceae bacterium]|nr:SIMPL domain-containing protein [Muribaculaceae bacterium]
MEKNNRTLAALLIALGLACLGWFIYTGINNLAYRDRQVTVRGLAEKEVMANKVTWPLVVTTLGNNLPELYNRINANNDIVLKFLKDNGISDAEISVNEPQVFDKDAQTYSSGNLPFRYRVTEVITVTSDQVEKVNALMKRQAELLKQGVALANDYQYQTLYEYTGLNDIKPEMIAQATAAAREAAKKFADDSGSDLGKIKTASQGQFSIEDRDSYTPYIKNVRVVTSITYYLED